MALHPNQRYRVSMAMRKLLLAHMNTDQVLDYIAEELRVTKKLAAELVPKDSSELSREVLSLFISAEITTGMNRGLPTESAVRNGFQRFDVTPPHDLFMRLVRSFEKERNRLAALRPGEHDNGVGGTMEIVDGSGNPIHVGPQDLKNTVH